MLSSTMGYLLVSLIGGILGKLLHPGDDGNGLIKTIILGILGSMLGNFLSSRFLGTSMDGVSLQSIGIATAGSVIVLFIWRAIQKKKA
jgi:uncharacterized membrane protein YeaQ/YmgE (transglycosylase-associated protein family)